PGGVADPRGRLGYVAGNAIDALDLRTGELRWQAAAAARPVLADEQRVAALQTVAANERALQVVVLAAKDGQMVLTSHVIEFPDWVHATVRPDEFFSYQVRAEDDALLLAWQACARYSGGANPSAYILAQANKEAAGVARVD